MSAEDWEALSIAAVRRRTSKSHLLLQLAAPGIAELRRLEHDREHAAGGE